jgi:uncharacterized protein YbcC (UPF0753/DUF2309 family)
MFRDLSGRRSRLKAFLPLVSTKSTRERDVPRRRLLLEACQLASARIPWLGEARDLLYQHPLTSYVGSSFPQALGQLENLSQAKVWPDLSFFRQLYHRGHIELGDLRTALVRWGERTWPRSSQHTQVEHRLLQELFADSKQLRSELRSRAPVSLAAYLDQELGTHTVPRVRQRITALLQAYNSACESRTPPRSLWEFAWGYVGGIRRVSPLRGGLKQVAALEVLEQQLDSMRINSGLWRDWCEWALWLFPGWTAWLNREDRVENLASSRTISYLALVSLVERELTRVTAGTWQFQATYPGFEDWLRVQRSQRKAARKTPHDADNPPHLLTPAAAQEIWLDAWESAWRRQYLAQLLHQNPWLPQRLAEARHTPRPEFQGLFCIDPRCEPLRLAWEKTAKIETFSTAGSFALATVETSSASIAWQHLVQMLSLLAWKERFARLVMICGHSHPHHDAWHSAYLECTACRGRSGANHAQYTAALLNDRKVRPYLAQHGIQIPEDTWFVASLYRSDRPSIQILDRDQVPSSHAFDLESLEKTLDQAQAQLQKPDFSPYAPARSSSWSIWFPQHRSENLIGGAARHAACLIGPRSASAALHLDGRSFLHSYEPARDPEGRILARILGGPLQVILRINLQYYFASVDPKRWGAGPSQQLRDIGAGYKLRMHDEDLAMGLPEEALFRPNGSAHEPLRLQAFVIASGDQLRKALLLQPEVAQQLEARWLTLTVIDPDSGQSYLWQTSVRRSSSKSLH